MPPNGLEIDGSFGGPAGPTILDLADELPARATAISAALNLAVDQVVSTQTEKQLEKLMEIVASQLTVDGLGYLIKVNRMSFAEGTPYFPAGQVVTPIGLGTEPLDALASQLSGPSIQANVPRHVRDDSWYLWIYRQEGRLKAAQQMPMQHRTFEKRAHREMKRREALGFASESPVTGLKEINRAQAWADTFERLDNHVRDSSWLDKRKQYEDQLYEAQAQFNQAYADYQIAAEKAARAQKVLDILQVASTIGDLVSIGAALVEDNDTTLKSKMSYVETMRDAHSNYASSVIVTIEKRAGKIVEIERKLEYYFRQHGLDPPPKGDPLPQLRKP